MHGIFLNKFRVHMKYHFSRALVVLLSVDTNIREINTAQSAMNLIFCAITLWHFEVITWRWSLMEDMLLQLDIEMVPLVQTWKEFLSWRFNSLEGTLHWICKYSNYNYDSNYCFSGGQLEYMHKQCIISLAYFEFKRGDWCLVLSSL